MEDRRSTTRRVAALTLATAVACAGTAAGTAAGAAAAPVAPARAGGVDRYATASIAMGQVAFPQGTGTAVVATGEDFPDALAAAGLAGQADAALLLTDPDEPLQTTGAALEDLGVRDVHVLGGEGAVSREVADAYGGPDREVVRLGGADRYETAALVAREVARLGPLAEVAGRPAAFLATGEDHADALAAAAPAAAGSAATPVLLTRSDGLPEVTASALEDLGIGHVWLIGGDEAVDPTVQATLESRGIGSRRISGPDRWATAAAVARTFVDGGDLAGSTVTLARGDAFPDALVGGVTAAATDGPVLLTRSPDDLGAATRDYLAAPAAVVDVVRAMGGQEALTASALGEAESIAEAAGESTVPQSWLMSPQEPLTPPPGGVADFEVRPQPDGEALPLELHLALFDCRLTTATGPERSFTDADGDGHADGYATTEGGSAAIAVLNGRDVPDADALVVGPDVDGVLTFRLASPGADCAVPVVFDDTDRDGWLDVDAHGQPRERYNVGLARWE
ncbi:cell wall-binding repeat-containing protein [Kineococcus sp. TRM81007]|uniref:cell wall-binding repeat-containing protein n=1 Tax=Kineococcus sp. TRM81007 TaxID=2925831 RepID=UPI001F595AB7|nr:cell wall-binding repeat-containing protein [Kineococcus sp. TRM81007]MCI2239831.1 cell wall-binding repeat-containing protein [Kineococcus sp. TRM81007]